ncbi:penicillin-binding protein [Pontibacillus chungwhensis BH030062]|uniref:Penicillin-binding protein n=1 Tax=Pontibacillus chungwhensis BH030062 TaxID=1385513 RepID=A0A0A2V8K7_9BACI|nr:PBP1A family penicillin-binding protein [Pontibacillus chungwhensis]KGP90060.1 penicillin-binding protein [Pontibacillus chungwhensis BH030062]
MNWREIKIPDWVKRWRWLIIVVASMVVLAFAGYFTLLIGGKRIVDERLLVLDEASVIETRNGDELTKLYKENRTVVPIGDIPDHVENAFIAIEDGRFYEHAGVDVIATARALYRDLIAMEKVEGGSTITQQLSKNLFLTHDKTWTRKIKEVMASLYLERNVPKKKILEYYLNTIYFGNGLYGIESASQYFFNKPVSDISLTEGALLAALPKGPNYYDPIDHPERAKGRRDIVISRMLAEGFVTSEEAVQLQRKNLGINHGSPEEKPWLNSYLDYVVTEAKEEYGLSEDELYQGGYRIVVSVDEDIQRISHEVMQIDQYFPGSVEGVQGTFLLMDEETGEILAAQGGRNNERGDLNRLLEKRQPGSVMKPLAVYGPALDLEQYTPYSLLVDQKLSYGDYTPTNYDYKYDDYISIYKSLMLSKNASAVWLLNEIGIDYSKNYLEKLGMDLEDNGLSIALGGLKKGVTPVDLVRSYRTFIHDGEMIEPHSIVEIYDKDGELVHKYEPKPKQIFNPQTAWSITRMLESVVTEGTGRSGAYEKALAGKTGSTQHPYVDKKTKDAWFVGFTPEYVGSVWMGYDQSDEKHYLNDGSASPTKLMKEVLTRVDQVKQLEDSFTQPDGVEDVPPPIDLPIIDDLDGTLSFGSLTLLQAELTWTPARDDRVVYRIYREEEGQDERIGEVEGRGRYTIKRLTVFHDETYYIVPYDPLTDTEGSPSNQVRVEW